MAQLPPGPEMGTQTHVFGWDSVEASLINFHRQTRRPIRASERKEATAGRAANLTAESGPNNGVLLPSSERGLLLVRAFHFTEISQPQIVLSQPKRSNHSNLAIGGGILAPYGPPPSPRGSLGATGLPLAPQGGVV